MDMEVNPILPQSWDGWRILRLIGKGTTGAVYLAQDASGDFAAVKVIAQKDHVPSPRLLKLLHGCSGVVPIRRVESCGGCSFIAMDHLQSFTDKVFSSRLNCPETRLAGYMKDICLALHCISESGLLHRDIKPENLLLTPDDHCVLGDVDQICYSPGQSVEGTFAYMAPEVYFGEDYDIRADMYSLGMVFYRCSNRGLPPFVTSDRRILSRMDLEHSLELRMHSESIPVPMDATEGFAAILLRLCSFHPSDRFQTPKELMEALDRYMACAE